MLGNLLTYSERRKKLLVYEDANEIEKEEIESGVEMKQKKKEKKREDVRDCF